MKWILCIVAFILLPVLSYCYLDRWIVDFAYQHHFRSYKLLDIFTHIPELFMLCAPIALIVIALLKITRGRLAKYYDVLLLMSVSLLVTEQIKNGLKFVFARYWPATWINNNPSWLRDHSYGFTWFDNNVWYASFPSGHTALTFVCMSIVWCFYPRLRPIACLICVLVSMGLLGMYYHFLSDIIVGAYVGIAYGYLAVRYYRSVA